MLAEITQNRSRKKLNANILEVHNWLTDNELSLNFKKGKTEIMIFGTSISVKKAAPLNIQIKGPNMMAYIFGNSP